MTNRLYKEFDPKKLEDRITQFNFDLSKVLTNYCYDTTTNQEEIMINLRAMQSALFIQYVNCSINCILQILINLGYLPSDAKLDEWRNRLYNNESFASIAAEAKSLVDNMENQ